MSTLVSPLGWSLRLGREEQDQGQVHFAAHQSAIAAEVVHKERDRTGRRASIIYPETVFG